MSNENSGKFRKKPVVIEAVQFREADKSTHEHVNFGYPNPPGECSSLDGKYWIQTLEGPLHVCDGDWIITGVKGERYSCKPDIFEQTYEAVLSENGVWWCNAHRREATHVDGQGRHKCEPGLGGITLPCMVVFLSDVEIVR